MLGAEAATVFLCLQDEYRDAPGSVITADFYNASALLPLTDQEVVDRVKSHLEVCEPEFKRAQVTFLHNKLAA